LDILKNIQEDEIYFSIKDEFNPCVIEPYNKNKDYIAVVMPKRF
jgi:DNA polymerase III sliding clamp (beta) subunit (PCNA family)